MRTYLLALAACCALWGQAGRSPSSQIDEAIALQKNGSAREALTILRELVGRLRNLHDDANLARALTAATDAAFALGEYDAAIQTSLEAAGIHQKAGNDESEAEDWNTIGRANVYLGKYQPAIEGYEKALALDRKREDIEGEIVRLYNIGNVYFEQGRYLDAYQQYQSALGRVQVTAKEKWNPRRRQIVIANLAILFQRLGRYQQALELYLSLRDQSESIKASERAQLLANLGTLYRRLGDPGKALKTYREAQALFQQDHHPFGESSVLKNIGIVLALDLDRIPEALAAFEEARKLARASAAGLQTPIELYIGEALRQLGRVSEARSNFESALAGSRAGGSSEYEWQALRGIGQLEQQAGHPENALRLYRDAIARIESVRSGLELPVLRREFLGDKRQVYDAALAILLEKTEPPVEEIFELMEHSRARALQDRRLNSGAHYGLKDIQSRLAPGTLLLEFWAGPSGGAVLYATRSETGIRRRSAIDVAALRAAAGAQSGTGWRELSSTIGSGLLSDIPPLQAAQLRNIVVAPDGPLSLIPFELLDVPGVHQLLIERAPVSYLPAASLLLRESRTSRRSWAPWRRELLAFADPAAPPASVGTRADPLAGDQGAWTRLPASSAEVRAIAGFLHGRSELHIGPDAQKRHLLAASAQVPLVHISTHAMADYIDPERSRILFAPQKTQDGADYLFLREIYGLDLNGLDMVVLSACDTETGKLTGGEGVEGFAKAFLAAGAESTVTTLWPVEDHATSEFMKQFYFALAGGEPKAEALRRAKLSFLRSGSQLAHPHYWAGFVLNGDGMAPIPRVIGWPSIAIAIGLTALGALALERAWRTKRSKPTVTESRS